MRIYLNLKELILFQTQYNAYKYKILFFNLINGLIIFQRYINNILFNFLDNFVIIYFNNILIYLKDELEYIVYIRKII